MKKNIEKQISDTVTEKPVIIPIPFNPKTLFERILFKFPRIEGLFIFFGLPPLQKTIKVKALKFGTLYQISGLINEIEIPKNQKNTGLDWVFQLIEKNALKVAEIIAAGVHNSRAEMPPDLINYMLDLTPAQNYEIVEALKNSIDIESFISTIVLIRSLNILIPEETSLANTGEKIALGAESEPR